jgi:CheY-like chemotaxis protein
MDDIGMPKMDGYEVCVLIAQTGWGGQRDRERTQEAGFDGHLVKPVALPELLKLFSELHITA